MRLSIQHRRRLVAIGVLVCFLTSNLPPLHAQNSPSKSFLSFPQTLSLPTELGSIRYQNAKNFPELILIQDAHEIPEAQRNIAKLIEYLSETYGISQVALEGASGELDAQIFKSFPDKKRLAEVMEKYFEDGEITGGAAAAITSGIGDKGTGISEKQSSTPYPLPPNPDSLPPVHFSGIEDWNLFQDGIEAYQKAMSQEKELSEALSVKREELRKEKEKFYQEVGARHPPAGEAGAVPLREIDRAMERFYENESNFIETLKVLAKYGGLSPKGTVPLPEELGLILKKSIDHSPWTLEMQSQELKKIADQVEKTLKTFKPSAAMDYGPWTMDMKAFHSKLQEYQTSQITPEAFALYLKELIAKYRLSISFSSGLHQSSEEERKMRDLEGTELMETFEKFAEQTFQSRITSGSNTQDSLLKTHHRSKELRLLTKLVKLELTRKEWHEISTEYRVLSTEYREHFNFYENSEKREEAFMRKLTTHDSQLRTIFVAGGFHTQGMTERLKAEGISYAVVMPKISHVPEETNYRKHMQGDVSWKHYFRVENGTVNLYEAFVRGTRDKLVSEELRVPLDSARGSGEPVEPKSEEQADEGSSRFTFHSSQQVLKPWRDQILRDLSDQGRIAEAGNYTRFIDEMTEAGSENPSDPLFFHFNPSNPFYKRVNHFMQQLKKLQSDKNLTEPAILNVLQSMMPSGYACSGVLTPSVSLPIRSELRTPSDEAAMAVQAKQNPKPVWIDVSAREKALADWNMRYEGHLSFYSWGSLDIDLTGHGGLRELKAALKAIFNKEPSLHYGPGRDVARFEEMQSYLNFLNRLPWDSAEDHRLRIRAYGALFALQPILLPLASGVVQRDKIPEIVKAWTEVRGQLNHLRQNGFSSEGLERAQVQKTYEAYFSNLENSVDSETRLLQFLDEYLPPAPSDIDEFYQTIYDQLRLNQRGVIELWERSLQSAGLTIEEEKNDVQIPVAETGNSERLIHHVRTGMLFSSDQGFKNQSLKELDTDDPERIQAVLRQHPDFAYDIFLEAARQPGMELSPKLLKILTSWVREIKKENRQAARGGLPRAARFHEFVTAIRHAGLFMQFYDSGLLDLALPELDALRASRPAGGISDKKHFHRYDTARHSVYLVDHLLRKQDHFLSDANLSLAGHDRVILIYALLLHDASKHSKWDYFLSPDHGIQAARKLVGDCLKRVAPHLTEPEVLEVAWLVWNHPVLIGIAERSKPRRGGPDLLVSYPDLFNLGIVDLLADPQLTLQSLQKLYALTYADEASVNPAEALERKDRLDQVFQFLCAQLKLSPAERSRQVFLLKGNSEKHRLKAAQALKERVVEEVVYHASAQAQNLGRGWEDGIQRVVREYADLSGLSIQEDGKAEDRALYQEFLDELKTPEQFGKQFDSLMDFYPVPYLVQLLAQPDQYFAKIIFHMLMLSRLKWNRANEGGLHTYVLMQQQETYYQSFLEITVADSKDKPGFLYGLAAALGALGLSLHKVYATTHEGLIFDIFHVYLEHDQLLDLLHQAQAGGRALRDIREDYFRLIQQTVVEAATSHRLDSLKWAPIIGASSLSEQRTASVAFLEDQIWDGGKASVLRIDLPDRTGLIRDITGMLQKRGINILAVDAATHLTGAHDDFYLVAKNGSVLNEDEKSRVVDEIIRELPERDLLPPREVLGAIHSELPKALEHLPHPGTAPRSELREKGKGMGVVALMAGVSLAAGFMTWIAYQARTGYRDPNFVLLPQQAESSVRPDGGQTKAVREETEKIDEARYHPFRSRHTFAEDINLHREVLKRALQEAVKTGRDIVFVVEHVPFSDAKDGMLDLLRREFFQHDLNKPEHFQKVDELLRKEADTLQERLQLVLDQWQVPVNYEDYFRALIELAVETKGKLAVGQSLKIGVERVTPPVWKEMMENLLKVANIEKDFESGNLDSFVARLKDFDESSLPIFFRRDLTYEKQIESWLRQGYEVFDFRGSLHPPRLQGKVLQNELKIPNPEILKAFERASTFGMNRLSSLMAAGVPLTEADKKLLYAKEYPGRKLVSYFMETVKLSRLSSYEKTQVLLEKLTWEDLLRLSKFLQGQSGYAHYLDQNKGRVIYQWIEENLKAPSRSEVRADVLDGVPSERGKSAALADSVVDESPLAPRRILAHYLQAPEELSWMEIKEIIHNAKKFYSPWYSKARDEKNRLPVGSQSPMNAVMSPLEQTEEIVFKLKYLENPTGWIGGPKIEDQKGEEWNKMKLLVQYLNLLQQAFRQENIAALAPWLSDDLLASLRLASRARHFAWRFEKGPFLPVKVDVNELLKSFLAVQNSNPRIIYENSKPLYVWTYEGVLDQVLANLLDNAAYEAQKWPDGFVKIEIIPDPNHQSYQIVIRNTGAMPQDVLSKVSSGYTTKPEGQGSGVGIPSSLRLTHMLGGRLRFEPNIFTNETAAILEIPLDVLHPMFIKTDRNPDGRFNRVMPWFLGKEGRFRAAGVTGVGVRVAEQFVPSDRHSSPALVPAAAESATPVSQEAAALRSEVRSENEEKDALDYSDAPDELSWVRDPDTAVIHHLIDDDTGLHAEPTAALVKAAKEHPNMKLALRFWPKQREILAKKKGETLEVVDPDEGIYWIDLHDQSMIQFNLMMARIFPDSTVQIFAKRNSSDPAESLGETPAEALEAIDAALHKSYTKPRKQKIIQPPQMPLVEESFEVGGEIKGQGLATLPARTFSGRLAFWKSQPLEYALYDFNPEDIPSEIRKVKMWAQEIRKVIQASTQDRPILEKASDLLDLTEVELIRKLQKAKKDEGVIKEIGHPIEALYLKWDQVVELQRAGQDLELPTLEQAVRFLKDSMLKTLSPAMTKFHRLKVNSNQYKSMERRKARQFFAQKKSEYDDQIRQIRESMKLAQAMIQYYEAEKKAELAKGEQKNNLELAAIERKLQQLRDEKLVQHVESSGAAQNTREMNTLEYMKKKFEEVERRYLGDDKSPQTDSRPLWDRIYEDWALEEIEVKSRRSPDTILFNEHHQAMGDILLGLRTYLGETILKAKLEEPSMLEAGPAQDRSDLILVIQGTVNPDRFKQIMETYEGRIVGILATEGSLSSHWAMIAQTMRSRPSIMVVTQETFSKRLQQEANPGEEALFVIQSSTEIKGNGSVIIKPTSSTLKTHISLERIQQEMLWLQAMDARSLQPLPPGIKVMENTDLTLLASSQRSELRHDGIGLTRTEFMTDKIKKSIKLIIQKAASTQGKNMEDALRPAIADLFTEMKGQFALYFADESNRGKEITIRTLDLWPDKNKEIVDLLREHPELVIDPKQSITGFYFYTNTKIGKLIVGTQIASMLAAHAKMVAAPILKLDPASSVPSLENENPVEDKEKWRRATNHWIQSEVPKLKIMFPMVRSVQDGKVIAEEILPFAEKYAFANLGLDETRFSEPDMRKWIGYKTEWGIMVENLDAISNLEKLVEAKYEVRSTQNPNFRTIEFQFFSVGTNDLWEAILTALVQEKTKDVSIQVTRDHPLMNQFSNDLDKKLIENLNQIARTVASFNAKTNHPKKLSVCGDIAGFPKFMVFVEYWRRKGLPISISAIPSKNPELRYLARQLANPDRVSSLELNDIFDRPGHHSNQAAEALGAKILDRDKPLLSVLESWNDRFSAQDLEFAFEQQELDIERGMGGAAEFDFLKAVIRALEPMGVLVELSAGERMQSQDLEAIVSYLGKKHAFFYQKPETIQVAFQFLTAVREVYQELSKEGKIVGPVRDENIQFFLENLKAKGVKVPRSVNEIQEQAADYTPQSFYEAYHAISLYVFDSITRTVHDLYSSKEIGAFPPIYLKKEGILGSPEFGIQKREGLRLSRQRGYVEETVWEVDMPDAAKHIQERPELILEAFRLVTVMGRKANLSHETQKVICEYLSVPANREEIKSLMQSSEDATFRLAWIDWLSENNNNSYGDFRLHQFGMFDLMLEHYAKSMTRFSSKSARFSAGMQAVHMRQVMEGLSDRKEPIFRQVRAVHSRIRNNKESLRTLRLAAYIGPTLTKFNAADLEELPAIENNVRTLLESKKMNDPRLEIDFENMVKDIAWILYFYHKISRQDLLGDEEQNPILDEIKSKERSPECMDMLYVYAFASRFSLFDPDAREMVLREGEVSPLKSIDRLYERAILKISSNMAEIEILDRHQDDFQKAILEHDAWRQIKERYLRETGLRQQFEGNAKTAIHNLDQRIQHEFENNFDKFFLQFCSFFSFPYILSLDQSSVLKLMVVFRVLQILQEDQRDETLILINRLPHHSQNSFEVLFLVPREDEPVLPVFYSGTLFREGFNTSIAQIRHTSVVRKQNPRGLYSFVKFLGFAEKWKDEMLIYRNVRQMTEKAERVYQRSNSFSGLDSFFDGDHPHLVEKHDGFHTQLDFDVKDVTSHSQPVSVVTIESAERKGLLYSTLRWLFANGFSVRDLRFDNLESNVPRIKFWLQNRNREALSPEEKHFVAHGDLPETGGAKSRMGLRAVLDQAAIDPGVFQMPSAARSELRLSNPETSDGLLREVADQLGDWMRIHPPETPFSDSEHSFLKVMSKKLKELLAQPGAMERLEELLMEQVTKLENKSSAPAEISLQITREKAEAISQYLVERMLSKLKDRSGVLSFREVSNPRDLAESLRIISRGLNVTQVTLPLSLRGQESSFPRLTYHFRKDPSQIPTKTGQLVPVLGETPDAGRAQFYVGLDAVKSFENEPFLGVVAQVLQMTAGLLAADRIQSVADLQNPAIRADLLRELFESYPDQGRVIHFDEKGFRVDRSALAQFILSYQASRQSSISA